MKIKTLENIALILFILGGFVTFKVLFGVEPITLESRIAILITIIPAIIIEIFVHLNKKKKN